MLETIEKSDDPDVGHTILRAKGPGTAVRELCQQIDMFWRDEYPFHILDHGKIDDPLAWWQDLAKHNHAHILGVSVPVIGSLSPVHVLLIFDCPRFSQLKFFRSLSTQCLMNVPTRPLHG